jgi:guanine deaminase
MKKEDRKRYMQMAIDLSEQSIDEKKGGPFGAVIVKDNRIIGGSGNCEFALMDPCAHAEIMAIRDACKNLQTLDLSGAEIFSSAEPCPMCLAAIYWVRIKIVYFSNTEEQSLKYGFLDKIILRELRKTKSKRKIQGIHLVNPKAIQVFEKTKKAVII